MAKTRKKKTSKSRKRRRNAGGLSLAPIQKLLKETKTKAVRVMRSAQTGKPVGFKFL